MKWIIPAAVIAGVLAVGGWYMYSQQTTPAATTISSGDATTTDGADVDTSGVVEMVLGNPDAMVEVIEYASFTCPHCARFHESTFKQLKTDYIDNDKIKFVYREVYFDKYGMWASLIARCAGPDKFFGISDLLYKGQSTWARAGDDAAIADELRKIGRLAGIEGDALDACLGDGEKLKTLVAWYQANAQADQIQSTPSFVINGELYSNMSYSEFSALLDEQLNG